MIYICKKEEKGKNLIKMELIPASVFCCSYGSLLARFREGNHREWWKNKVCKSISAMLSLNSYSIFFMSLKTRFSMVMIWLAMSKMVSQSVL